MKKALFILLLAICSHSLVAAQQPDIGPASDNSYFEQAYTEIAAMLDGKAPLSIKRAVFLQEWAYLDGDLNYDHFGRSIDSAAQFIKKFIAANQIDKYKTGKNLALTEYFFNPYSGNHYKPFIYDVDDDNAEDTGCWPRLSALRRISLSHPVMSLSATAMRITCSRNSIGWEPMSEQLTNKLDEGNRRGKIWQETK